MVVNQVCSAKSIHSQPAEPRATVWIAASVKEQAESLTATMCGTQQGS